MMLRATSIGCGGPGYWRQRADVVVVGTGVAGLAAARAAHGAGARVIVVSKARETATFYAQGGIAVVIPDGDDSVEAHVADTVEAGAGLCDIGAVTSIVADGYAAVAELVGAGASFDEATPGRWSVTREGGHRRRRIIHAGGDATGAEVQRALNAASATLDIRSDHVALQILHNDGAVAGLAVRTADGLGVLEAPSVILATGGLGHLYRATTNPDGSTGDGVALALWAGLPASDIEFIQFHPTMLYAAAAGGRRPLITEALRGEGAMLIDGRGESVTAGVHPMGDLAPRDVVAAAINTRLAITGDDCVYLDARAIADVERRFPTVTASCRAAGIDIAHQPIPVVPGAHYSCGGVSTDVHGRTEMPGLYAAGEVARTGMHGANRLASNSLLEGLVVGGRAGRDAASYAREADRKRLPSLDSDVRPVVTRSELQDAMTTHASVVRDASGLERLDELLTRTTDRAMADRPVVEDAALTVVASAVAVAAAARAESRGCHHRGDHPGTDGARAAGIQVRLDVDGQMRVAQQLGVSA